MTNEQAKACAEEICKTLDIYYEEEILAIIQRHAGKDAERLDWLNTNQQGLTACFGFAPMGTGKPLPFEGWLIGTTSGEPEFTDIRQAIDDAMNQTKGTE